MIASLRSVARAFLAGTAVFLIACVLLLVVGVVAHFVPGLFPLALLGLGYLSRFLVRKVSTHAVPDRIGGNVARVAVDDQDSSISADGAGAPRRPSAVDALVDAAPEDVPTTRAVTDGAAIRRRAIIRDASGNYGRKVAR